MPISRARYAWLGAALLALAVGSCFVKLGECVSQGVAIDPCVNPMRIGQTTTLQAHVDGAPGADVTWVLPTSLGFQPHVGPNSLQLIGNSNIAGTYRIRAQSTSDASLYGEAFLAVAAQNFGYPPPPIQINGADGPPDYQSAVASGGGYYYLAYANLPNPSLKGNSTDLVGGSDPSNYYVRQYSASTNIETAVVLDQFTGFQGPGLGPIEPNIGADCHGNGYWVDWTGKEAVLRKLGPGGGFYPDQSLSGMSDVTNLVIACDGAIYFWADDCGDGCIHLFRMPSFGQAPVELNLPDPLSQVYDLRQYYGALAIDPEGRLLLGGLGLAYPYPVLPRLIRLIVDAGSNSASFDPEFALSLGDIPDFASADQVAVDGAGAIYAAVSGTPQQPLGSSAPRIVCMNELGLALYTIINYVNHCPTGCDVDCGATLPFHSIQSLSAGTNGELFVMDDVDMAGTPVECQVTVRMILLHP